MAYLHDLDDKIRSLLVGYKTGRLSILTKNDNATYLGEITNEFESLLRVAIIKSISQVEDTLALIIELLLVLNENSGNSGVVQKCSDRLTNILLTSERFSEIISQRLVEEYISEPLSRGSKFKPQDRLREQYETALQILESFGTYTPNVDRVLFFLGAGVSKPKPSNIPPLSELLSELWKKSNKMDTKPLSKLESWCKENDINNIEEMLTAVTISNLIIGNPKVGGLLRSVLYPKNPEQATISLREVESIKFLDETLNSVFSILVGTMLIAKPNLVHMAIADYAKRHKNFDIVTTNYDVCLEQAFDQVKIKYDYILGGVAAAWLKIIKMHGSINWYYCESCQSVFTPSIMALSKSIENSLIYAINGMCPNCQALVKQFIIPPISHKYLTHPPIVQVWEEGRRRMEAANAFVIAGYSFSDADDYIAKMLIKAISHDRNKVVVVIDRDSGAIERCRSIIRNHIKDFEEFNHFFGINADVLTFLPEVIHVIEKLQRKPSKNN